MFYIKEFHVHVSADIIWFGDLHLLTDHWWDYYFIKWFLTGKHNLSPQQVFSTYSVTEYDRKNDEVDPVAASAEYELEKRVEKMDVFPVEIVKGKEEFLSLCMYLYHTTYSLVNSHWKEAADKDARSSPKNLKNKINRWRRPRSQHHWHGCWGRCWCRKIRHLCEDDNSRWSHRERCKNTSEWSGMCPICRILVMIFKEILISMCICQSVCTINSNAAVKVVDDEKGILNHMWFFIYIYVFFQIIEVDGKSLVGVTQVFAASVLKNTSGRVHFLIGREKDPENSEVALLIKQSLQVCSHWYNERSAWFGFWCQGSHSFCFLQVFFILFLRNI